MTDHERQELRRWLLVLVAQPAATLSVSMSWLLSNKELEVDDTFLHKNAVVLFVTQDDHVLQHWTERVRDLQATSKGRGTRYLAIEETHSSPPPRLRLSAKQSKAKQPKDSRSRESQRQSIILPPFFDLNYCFETCLSRNLRLDYFLLHRLTVRLCRDFTRWNRIVCASSTAVESIPTKVIDLLFTWSCTSD
ncbi:putative aspartic-type endopeptidase opsB [Fusarium oxysporum f. sp. albedinis]|nr:putative aspartic-type endopeptidase opsB [Fusarium oxysporum f. sp. albedinis]